MKQCPAEDTTKQHENFWKATDWPAQRVEWAIAGVCAAIVVILTLVNVSRHALHYSVPLEQRQILRILYMPLVFTLISFFSFNHYNGYTYFGLLQAAYESVTLSAFLLLLIQYVASITVTGNPADALAQKEKRKLPVFRCFRFRPSKAYFIYAIKWAILQYIIVRPICSLLGVIAEANNVFCESEGLNLHYAYGPIEIVTVISMVIALYGLIVFFLLVKDDIQSRSPLLKFFSVKFLVFVPVVQNFILSILKKRDVITATSEYTATEVTNGINALLISIETVILSIMMLVAYKSTEYAENGLPSKGIFRAMLDPINPTDFIMEIYTSLRFLIGERTVGNGKSRPTRRITFGQAFNVDGRPTEQVSLGHYRSPSTAALTRDTADV